MANSSHILPDEKELFDRVATGDAIAFEEIYHHYNKFLEPFLLNKTKSRQQTEEIIQDVYLKLWERRETLPGIENYRSYIYTMAVNFVYLHFRQAATETKVLKQLYHGMAEQRNSTEEVLELKESESLINQAIDLLPAQQKRIYLLSRRQGLSHDEIAAELNISKRTVSNQLTDALRFIKQHLGKTAGAIIAILFR